MMLRVISFSFMFLFSFSSIGGMKIDSNMAEWGQTQLKTKANGFTVNTGGDAYFVIQNLEIPRASIRAIRLEFEVEKKLTRPILMEFFWRSATLGFSEHEKAMFVVNPNNVSNEYDIILPIYKLYNFSGNLNYGVYQEPVIQFRIDYPMLHKVSMKFENIEYFADNNYPQGSTVMELHETIAADNFLNGDVIVPKFIDLFVTGLKKFTQDWLFTLFWLGCIIATLFYIRRTNP